MTRRQSISTLIAGTLAVLAVGGGVAWCLKPSRQLAQTNPTEKASPWTALAAGLRRGDPGSLNTLCQMVLENHGKPLTAVSETEGAELIEVLDSLRAGFLKYAPVGRASAVAASTHILDHFRIEPAPRCWGECLRPTHDLLIAGLADAQVDVRSSALNEVGQHWSWLPGRTMTPVEEHTLADWKDSLYEPAKRCLSDRDPKSRAAAVVCIGALPIDSMAAPAVANAEYPDHGGVRYKTLMTFANRPNLLTIDMILKRLHDPEPGVAELSEVILKGRGLSKEQIFLGRQITNPHPEVRVSVIPLIRDRTDIDPVVWFLQLSHDPDDVVRMKAVEALIERASPEVDHRMREIVSTDQSPAVRSAAGKHVARSAENATVALPVLPGSSNLNPKAN